MTPETYDLYGTNNLSMEELRDEVERILGIEFNLHDSLYLGGDYFLSTEPNGDRFAILINHFDFDGEPEILRPEYSNYSVILDISHVGRGDELREKLGGIDGLEFLRRVSR